MPIVKNVRKEPFYINLSGGGTVKVPARGTAEISRTDLESPAVLFHLSRGNLVVVEREES